MFFKFNNYTRGSFGSKHNLVEATSSNFGTNYNMNRYNSPYSYDDLLFDSVLEQWMPRNPILLNRLFRTIHKFDSIAGPAVDLISIMPFSDVTLVGVEDPSILKIYEKTVSELHIETLLPEIATEYLVIGRVIGSLLFDSNKGIWTDVILQDPDFCEVINVPLRGYDPKINLKISSDFKNFLLSNDPRDVIAKKDIPDELLTKLIKCDTLPLDPASTLYLCRQTYPGDFMGSSIYYRILPFFALERSLLSGTLVGAKRRQRSILHITVGETDLWEPEEEDISTIAGMFVRADEDPQGAIVATRHGVETSEVRSGGDFWKISDEWDFLSTAKMRALGINESFLCVTGDTLIPTEDGILRIDSIKNDLIKDKSIDLIKDKPIDLDVVVSSKNCNSKALKWYYRGIDKVIETKTRSGRIIKTTENHKVLILYNNELIWKKTKDLKYGDLLCVSLNKCTSNKKLELIFPEIVINKHATNLKIPTAPKYMTPELAFILGLLVSEGSCDSNRVRFSNSNKNLLNRYKYLIKKIFNLDSEEKLIDESGKEIVICNTKTTVTRDNYEITIWSKVLSEWVSYLGIDKSNGNDKKSCWHKVVPWSILQADEESQLSYLAAYVEGDGSIQKNGKCINFYSRSLSNLRQLQIILASHGVLSFILEKYYRLTLDVEASCKLYNKFEKYLINKNMKNFVSSEKSYRKFGIPTKWLNKFLFDRKIQSNHLGTWFRNDDGNIIFIDSWGTIDKSRWNYLLYQSYRNGMYDRFLDALYKISKIEYNKVISLLNTNYYYDCLINQKYIGKHKLYDISMEKGAEPAFVGNSLVIHNSGDANYNCCIKDTLIPTNKGLLKIGEIIKDDTDVGSTIDIDLLVASKYDNEKAVKWMYSGYLDTVKVTTELGNEIECTYKQPLLVLTENLDLKWKMAIDIKPGDTVCISTKSLVRKTKLPLNLSDPINVTHGGQRKEVIKPEYMSSELAFIIGCLISKGTINEDNCVCYFYNSDLTLIRKFMECIKKVFGLDVCCKKTSSKNSMCVINGKSTMLNKDCHTVYLRSKTVVEWMKELGLYTGKSKERSPSYYKIIPWSILQADEISQLSYLAAYLEGDGSVRNRISYLSKSKKLILQTQTLLNSYGVVSKIGKNGDRLELNALDSFLFWKKIEPYMVSKKLIIQKRYKARNSFGFSNSYIKKFLKSKKIKTKTTRYGTVYINDQNDKVYVVGCNPCNSDKKFLYDKYERGDYDRFLFNLRKISNDTYSKIVALLKLRYKFTKVKTVVSNGKQHVYDISMKKGAEPAFIANGLVVHNTMDVALSIFIESIRNFRDYLVNRIFYEKLFPTIAEVHGFIKRSQAELDHKIRITAKSNSNLIIPQMNFHKQLRPEADTDYLDVLNTMEEKGIPIPLRTWAAAGGLNLERVFEMRDEDIENRKFVKEWKKDIGVKEEEEEKEGAWGSFSNIDSELIKNSLKALPIWIKGKFFDIKQDSFVKIIKSNSPKKKILSMFSDNPKQLAAASYVLKRMGITTFPIDVSVITKDIVAHFKKCSSLYSHKKLKNEFIILNNIIKNSTKKDNKKSIINENINKNLYVGIN